MKICVFAYNFKHKKTQEGIIKLISNKYKISQVIAMNKIKLNSPKKKIEITIKDINYIHPKILCESLKIPYSVISHNSSKCIRFLKNKKFDVGIILGARILKEELINCFKIGILNLHPGLLPENRGLDTHQWAILNMAPQGVTAHLIDRKMDRGRILVKKKIKIYAQDSLKDFFYRTQSLEMDLMIESLKILRTNRKAGYVAKNQGTYHSYIARSNEKKIIRNLTKYKNKFK